MLESTFEADTPLFLKFMNMMINDATVQLDEALSVCSVYNCYSVLLHMNLVVRCGINAWSSTTFIGRQAKEARHLRIFVVLVIAQQNLTLLVQACYMYSMYVHNGNRRRKTLANQYT